MQIDGPEKGAADFPKSGGPPVTLQSHQLYV